jgi:hypothetical protein
VTCGQITPAPDSHEFGMQSRGELPKPDEAVSVLLAKVTQFVPSGFRDEDGVWWDGPHRLEAQRAIDDLRAVLAARDQQLADAQGDANHWYETAEAERVETERLQEQLRLAEAERDESLRANTNLTIRHGIAIRYLADFAPKAHEMFLHEVESRTLNPEASQSEAGKSSMERWGTDEMGTVAPQSEAGEQ